MIGSTEANPSLEARSNHLDLPRLTGWRVIGSIPAGVGRLNPDDFRSAATTWL